MLHHVPFLLLPLRFQTRFISERWRNYIPDELALMCRIIRTTVPTTIDLVHISLTSSNQLKLDLLEFPDMYNYDTSGYNDIKWRWSIQRRAEINNGSANVLPTGPTRFLVMRCAFISRHNSPVSVNAQWIHQSKLPFPTAISNHCYKYQPGTLTLIYSANIATMCRWI